MNLSSNAKRIWEIIKTCSDWILLIALEVACQFIGDRKPFEQLFSVLDPTISFPMAAHERVPGSILYVYCFGIPAASVLIVSMAFGPGDLKRRTKLLNWGLLGVGVSVIVAQLFTEVVKFIVGRPRPDFLSRCQPDAARAQAAFTATAVALFDSSICTSTDASVINDGFRSFPSGHSSMSFAGLTYLALYLAGRFRLFAPHSPHGKHLYAYFITAAPILVASFITTSRVSDFRHRGTDVLGGASLGVFFAIVGYRYYFPWPNSQFAGIPWMTIRQEEERGIPIALGGLGKLHQYSPSTTRLPLLPTSQDARSVAQASQGAPTPYSDVGGNPMEMHPISNTNTYSAPPPHTMPGGSH